MYRSFPSKILNPMRKKLPTQFGDLINVFLAYPKKANGQTAEQYKLLKKKYRNARTYLKKVTGSAPECDKAEQDCMLDVIPNECLPLVKRYFDQLLTTEQLKATKTVLHLLAFDEPIRAFMPSAIDKFIKELTKTELDLSQVVEHIDQVQKVSPELCFFLRAFYPTQNNVVNADGDAKAFLVYLLEQKSSLESSDPNVEEAIEIVDSYNPPKLGRFYYFHPDGVQVR
ncbi:uncharacterized protein, partial [Clytia hemisphaerica]|uniref:uncharacterized protein n=1 Tax=Clytia hemisphaerica TaxID=252671 RepID=UPI0034D4D48A